MTKKEIDIRGVFAVVFLTLVVAVFFAFFYEQPVPVTEEQSCKMIDPGKTLQIKGKRVCEIEDVRGNIIESFYGPFEYTEGDTYGEIVYSEPYHTWTYLILPAGKISIYDLESEESLQGKDYSQLYFTLPDGRVKVFQLN